MMAKSIDALPVELIAQIVVASCEGLDAERADPKMLAHALSISSVSSLWREITLSTPKLWSRITLWSVATIVGKHASGKLVYSLDPRAITRLQAQLERSDRVPIDVIIEGLAVGNLDDAKMVWDTLSSHVHRFRSLQVDNLDDPLVDLVLPLRGPGPLKYLETLHITISDREAAQVASLFDSEDFAPNLAKLYLNFTNPTMRIPTASLVDFTFLAQFPSRWSIVASLLKQASHLQRASFFFLAESEESAQEPVILPNLTSLLLFDARFGHFFRVPEVEHLECPSYVTRQSLQGLLHLPPLKWLKLQIPTPEAVNSWSLSPSGASIHTLELFNCQTTKQVFDFLMSRTDQDHAFPSLRKLILDRCGDNMTPLTLGRHLIRLLEHRPKLHVQYDSNSFDFHEDEKQKIDAEYGARLSKVSNY